MAGNKINEQKAKTIFNIATLNLSVSKWIGLVVCVMLVLCLAWWQKDYLSHLLGFDKAFTKSDTRFKVLVLPFKQLCDDKRDVGEVIKSRLMDLDKSDTLNIALYYANIAISNNFTDDSATYYMQYHNADFVVYGQYQDKNCGGKGKDEYCMNYQTSPEWAKSMDEKNSRNTDKGMQMGNLEDIRNGALTTNIDFVVYYVAGVSQSNQENYLKSITHFNKAIKLDTKNVKAYYNRGNAYRYLQKYTEAIADYNKVIELDTNDATAYYNRGDAYADQEKYSQAIADFSKAIELEPKFAFIYYYKRGDAYDAQKEYPQAIADFSKAIELEPKFAAAYNNRGLAYYYQQNYPQAIANFSKAIELKPKYVVGYIGRGRVYDVQQKYAQAIADFSKVIELDPKYANAYHNRGNAYADLKEYAQDIADYSKAIELNPKFAKAYYNRGIAYYNQQKYAQAIADFNKALSLLDPNDPFVATVKQNLQDAKNNKNTKY